MPEQAPSMGEESNLDDWTVDRALAHLPANVASRPEFTRHRQLLRRILTVLLADRRFLAAWLWGSLTRDNADVYRDVDVYVAMADSDYRSLLTEWEDLVDRISPVVRRHRGALGNSSVVQATTPAWERFDLILVPLAEIGQPRQAPWILLFDRADVHRLLGPIIPAPRASPDRLSGLVQGFFGILGCLPVIVGRRELLIGVEGAMHLRRSVIDLMLIENERVHTSLFGLNRLLSPDQHRLLDALPPLVATRESVIAGHLACWEIFRPLARRLADRHGLTYPAQLEQATLAHLRKSLGVAVTGGDASESG